jgi:flagellin FlaB
MLKQLMKMHRKQDGITGLETAIILIAFVVVASVFAYTVLSAGLFSTQKSQEAVYAGLSETQSTLTLVGGVTAYQGDSNLTASDTVGKVSFIVALSSNNGQVVDLSPTATTDGTDLTSGLTTNPTQITFTNSDVTIPNAAWTLSWIGQNNENNILEKNEKAVITVYLHDYQDSAWADGANPPFLAANGVDVYDTFTLEVKPREGAVLNITRTMPAIIDAVVDLK